MATGKQKGDFPGAYIPFDKAVGPVPTVPIDASPTVQICINQDWFPFVVTCLKALSRPETWDDTYDNSVIAASEIAALISGYIDGCGVIVPSKMCASGSFKDLDYGFVPTPGSDCVATWASGTGWEMCADATPQGHLDIKREFGATTLIRAFSMTMQVTAPYLINYDVTLYEDGDFVSIASDTGVTGPDVVIDVNGLAEPASAIFIHVIETLGGAAADVVIQDFSICYTGAFPLSLNTSDQFTHVFDFTIHDGSPYIGTVPFGHWASGQGYVSAVAGDPTASQIRVWIDPPNSFDCLSLELKWSAVNLDGNDAGVVRGFSGFETGSVVMTNPAVHSDGSSFTTLSLAPGPANVRSILIGTDAHSSGGGQIVLEKLTISGIGRDPFV